MMKRMIVLDDAELLRFSLTDPSSFALIFDRHHPLVHRFLRARAGVELADELASEVFVVAFRRRASFIPSTSDARPWLFGIAMNLLRSHRRSESRRLRAHARLLDGEVMSGGGMDDRLDPRLALALAELNYDERNLILLFAWAELSYEELAAALDLPLGTVRSRLYRTRAKLRARLNAASVELTAATTGGAP
jgi:RNA polymerase sigma factor (sigma-70 family)